MKIIYHIRRKILECLYILIVTGLCSIAIYSVYCVLYAYIYENNLTCIYVENTNNILPFVKYFSVNYYISSVDGTVQSVIPQTWTMNSSAIREQNLFPGPYGMTAIERIAERKDQASFYLANNTDLSLDSQCDITSIAGMIDQMDRNFWLSNEEISKSLYLKNNDDFNGGQSIEVNFSDAVQLLRSTYYYGNQSIGSDLNNKLLSVIDSFIDNSYGSRLIDKVLAKLTPFKYARFDAPGKVDEFADLPVSYPTDDLGHNQVTSFVMFSYFANRTGDRRRRFPIQIGLFPSSFVKEYVTIYLSMSPLQEPGSMFYEGDGYNFSQVKKSFQADITIKNFGIYNTTRIRHKKDCKICRNFTFVDDCVYKCKLDATVDVCGCVPFGWRGWYRYDKKRRGMPLCTSKRYTICSKFTNFDSTHCTFDRFKPCLVARNTYSIQATYPADPPLNNTPKIVFRFTFDDKTYIVYKEDYQNSFMETLGQLGGNLGVFLNFSLLGVWQFCVFLHFTHNRYRENRRQKSLTVANQATNFVSPWLRIAQLTVEREAIGLGTIQQQSLEDQSPDFFVETEKQIETLGLEMEATYQKSNEEIDELKLINNALESRLLALEEKIEEE